MCVCVRKTGAHAAAQWSLQRQLSEGTLTREQWLDAVKSLMANNQEAILRGGLESTSDKDLSRTPEIDGTAPILAHREVEADRTELTTKNAASFNKKLRVHAFPVDAPVVVHKPWGESTAMPNDYFVIAGVDDVYTCKQEVFKATYEAVPGATRRTCRAGCFATRLAGERHLYQKVTPILARRMSEAFVARNSAGPQYGAAGSFLVQVCGACAFVRGSRGDVSFAAERGGGGPVSRTIEPTYLYARRAITAISTWSTRVHSWTHMSGKCAVRPARLAWTAWYAMVYQGSSKCRCASPPPHTHSHSRAPLRPHA